MVCARRAAAIFVTLRDRMPITAITTNPKARSGNIIIGLRTLPVGLLLQLSAAGWTMSARASFDTCAATGVSGRAAVAAALTAGAPVCDVDSEVISSCAFRQANWSVVGPIAGTASGLMANVSASAEIGALSPVFEDARAP